MDRLDLAPSKLVAVNPVVDDDCKARIVRSMKENGWVGRDLLVEEVRQLVSPPNYAVRYFAWTGSHRIEAAIEARLTTVPCRVLSSPAAEAAFKDAGYSKAGFEHWRGAVSSKHGRKDSDRLIAVEKAGLVEVAEMLREEMGATDGCDA